MTEPLRRLPIPLPPAANEVLTSYIGRLAVMHGLRDVELWNHLGVPDRPGRRRRITLGRLAAATEYPPGNLARALPELRDPAPEWPALRHLPQRACPRCTARHRGGPVRRLFAHHQYLCLRHGCWLGVPDPGRDTTPDRLATWYPELVAAQRRHQQAVARYGWRAMFSAVIVATGICVDLRFSAADHPLWHRWEKRLDRLIPPGGYDTYTRSRFVAVIYPEVVALATVIASPTWWSTSTRADPDELQRFLDAASQAVATPSTWPAHDPTHPAVRWAQTPTISLVPAEPAATFPEIGRLYHPRSGMVAQERLAEQKTARRFATDRRAPRTSGTPLPYAYRRPHPPPDGEHADRESAPPRHLPRVAAALPAQPAPRR